MQRAFLVFHRWLALVASLVLIVVALSGSAIVFEGALDRALNPKLWHVDPAGPVLSLDTLVARARGGAPGANVGSISLSPVPDRAFTLSAGPTQIFINPHTGTILGTRTVADRERSLARRLHLLHVTLTSGKVGSAIVGIATVAALVLVLSGLVVWWPEKLWRVQAGASWKRVTFDLHHALGVFASLVLLVITASGVVIHYEALGEAIGRLDKTKSPDALLQPNAEPGATAISFDSIAAVARAALPGATVMFVQSGGAKAPAMVAVRFAEDRTPGGRSRVFVDRYRGTVLLAVSTRTAELGTRINNLKRSLHTGDVLGKPTEAIWLLASLALAAQAVTGVLMWWNGRAARAADRARSAQGAAVGIR